MATKAFKNEKIQHFKSQFEKASAAYVADYRGYSVEQITTLRRLLQKENCDLTVTKNTLAKIAIKGTSYEPLTEVLEGPTAIAFGFGDQVAPAKILSKFIKDSKKGELLAACLDGELYDAKQAKDLASLPSKEELEALARSRAQRDGRRFNNRGSRGGNNGRRDNRRPAKEAAKEAAPVADEKKGE